MTILESIRFSYRFLMTLLVDSKDPKVKFAKLIEALENPQSILKPFASMLDAMQHPDPCQQQKPDWCISSKDLRNWVYCYFERIGQLIVLEAGEGPQLPIEGQIFTDDAPPTLVGTLHQDGTIKDQSGVIIGNVTITGQVVDKDGKPFVDKFGSSSLAIKDANGNFVGFVDQQGLRGRHEEWLTWLPAKDTCDLDKVRLIHLDGTSVTVDEYDRFQRFIRLWHKTGWTIDETDKALVGLSPKPMGGGNDDPTPTEPDSCDYVGFEVFSDDCAPGNQGTNGSCTTKLLRI